MHCRPPSEDKPAGRLCSEESLSMLPAAVRVQDRNDDMIAKLAFQT